MLSDNAFHWVTGIVSVLGVLVTLVIQFRAASRLNGQVTERIANHGTSIDGLKDEQVRQWQTIGEHGERIAAVEAVIPSMKRH